MESSAIVAIVILTLPWILLLISRFRRKNTEKELEDIQRELKVASHELAKFREKYSPILDIEEHVKKREDEVKEYTASLRDDAEKMISDAEQEAQSIKNEAKTLRSEATDRLKTSKEKSEEIKLDARKEADKIISFAQAQAQEIAGDAYEAKEKADSYEKAIRAMRNTIEGYKDNYIIPNHSVIDDLADEFGHKEAGEELKAARKRVRTMVKEGYAGECDYAEVNRRTYAIHFAVDAFNGKVDSALSKVKHDNYGKIKQEIIDAFALVNHNGSPFRNSYHPRVFRC